MTQIKLDGCNATLATGGYPVGYKGVKTATVFSLHTDKQHRNKGAAKRVMRAIRKWSDKTGRAVYLTAGPFDDQPVCQDKLIAFYITMGWRLDKSSDQNCWMVYTPRRKK